MWERTARGPACTLSSSRPGQSWAWRPAATTTSLSARVAASARYQVSQYDVWPVFRTCWQNCRSSCESMLTPLAEEGSNIRCAVDSNDSSIYGAVLVVTVIVGSCTSCSARGKIKTDQFETTGATGARLTSIPSSRTRNVLCGPQWCAK